jgi:hypothetical protein
MGASLDSDRLNRWLTLGANLGVLVGLILLIFEIEQNSDLVRAEIEQSRSESYVAWLRQGAANDQILELFVSMDTLEGSFGERFKQLEPIERMRFRQILEARFYDYENLFAQYEDGFVSQGYWEQRIAPSIAEWAPRWNFTNPPDGPGGRKEFKDEIRRIIQESE